MNHKNEETVAHQAADVVDNVADGVRAAAHNVAGNVQHAAHAMRDAAGRAAGAVEDTYDDVGQFARDSVTHTRDRLRSWESSIDSSVRENPKTALLLAAGMGAVLFALWRRK